MLQLQATPRQPEWQPANTQAWAIVLVWVYCSPAAMWTNDHTCKLVALLGPCEVHASATAFTLDILALLDALFITTSMEMPPAAQQARVV